MVRKLKMAFWVLLVFGKPLYGTDIVETKAKDITSQYERILKIEGRLQVEVVGHSHREARIIKWNRSGHLKKAFLIWGGELENSELGTRPLGRKIELNKQVMEADRFYKRGEKQEGAYTAWKEVTPWMKDAAVVQVRGIQTKGFGGFSLVGLFETESESPKTVIITVGGERVRPGELYEVEVVKANEIKGVVSRVTVVGGDGSRGNASSNGLNGVTLSGQDDWDGSNGEKWDIDSYEVKRFGMRAEKGIRWSIDPLLQWLYPMGVIVEIAP